MPFWRRRTEEPAAPVREVDEPVDPDFVDPSWEPDPADFADPAGGGRDPGGGRHVLRAGGARRAGRPAAAVRAGTTSGHDDLDPDPPPDARAPAAELGRARPGSAARTRRAAGPIAARHYRGPRRRPRADAWWLHGAPPRPARVHHRRGAVLGRCRGVVDRR